MPAAWCAWTPTGAPHAGIHLCRHARRRRRARNAARDRRVGGAAAHRLPHPRQLLAGPHRLDQADGAGRVPPHALVRVAEPITWTTDCSASCATGVSVASWTGLVNRRQRDWDGEWLKALGIEPDQLPAILRPGEAMTGLRREWSQRWPALMRRAVDPAAGRRRRGQHRQWLHRRQPHRGHHRQHGGHARGRAGRRRRRVSRRLCGRTASITAAS